MLEQLKRLRNWLFPIRISCEGATQEGGPPRRKKSIAPAINLNDNEGFAFYHWWPK
jgi:hypothetical protein